MAEGEASQGLCIGKIQEECLGTAIAQCVVAEREAQRTMQLSIERVQKRLHYPL